MMSKVFTSRPFIGIFCLGLGYLLAWVTLPPGFHQIADDEPSQERASPGPGSLDFRQDRNLGTSPSERRRMELAEDWENADMEAVIEKMGSVKTFESNTYDTGLSQELCDYLAISRSEKASIDQAIQSSVKKLHQLQIDSIEVTQIDDTTSKFVIKKFPDQGGDIKESLDESIRKALGLNRAFLFSKIARDSLVHESLNFGGSDVDITMKISGPPGAQLYETLISDGKGTRLFETKGVPPGLAHLLTVE